MDLASWLQSIRDGGDINPLFIWHVNKENIFKKYKSRYLKTYNKKGEEVHKKYRKISDPVLKNKYHSEMFILPNGKIITPIRQFCDLRVLPAGKKEGHFYGLTGSVHATKEGEIKIETPKISKSSVETSARGTALSVSFSDIEQPTDLIIACDKSFSLETLNDENADVLETGSKYAKHIVRTNTLRLIDVLEAKNVIREQGLDTQNAILYTTSKGILDLMTDPDLDKYLVDKPKRPVILTLQALETILGLKIVKSSKVVKREEIELEEIKESSLQKLKRYFLFRKKPMREKKIIWTRSILFLPNLSFGLVASELITMEALKRPEMQSIVISGTNRLASVLKEPYSAVVIEHGDYRESKIKLQD